MLETKGYQPDQGRPVETTKQPQDEKPEHIYREAPTREISEETKAELRQRNEQIKAREQRRDVQQAFDSMSQNPNFQDLGYLIGVVDTSKIPDRALQFRDKFSDPTARYDTINDPQKQEVLQKLLENDTNAEYAPIQVFDMVSKLSHHPDTLRALGSRYDFELQKRHKDPNEPLYKVTERMGFDPDTTARLLKLRSGSLEHNEAALNEVAEENLKNELARKAEAGQKQATKERQARDIREAARQAKLEAEQQKAEQVLEEYEAEASPKYAPGTIPQKPSTFDRLKKIFRGK